MREPAGSSADRLAESDRSWVVAIVVAITLLIVGAQALSMVLNLPHVISG